MTMWSLKTCSQFIIFSLFNFFYCPLKYDTIRYPEPLFSTQGFSHGIPMSHILWGITPKTLYILESSQI